MSQSILQLECPRGYCDSPDGYCTCERVEDFEDDWLDAMNLMEDDLDPGEKYLLGDQPVEDAQEVAWCWEYEAGPAILALCREFEAHNAWGRELERAIRDGRVDPVDPEYPYDNVLAWFD